MRRGPESLRHAHEADRARTTQGHGVECGRTSIRSQDVQAELVDRPLVNARSRAIRFNGSVGWLLSMPGRARLSTIVRSRTPSPRTGLTGCTLHVEDEIATGFDWTLDRRNEGPANYELNGTHV